MQPKPPISKLALVVLFSAIFSGTLIYLWYLLSFNTKPTEVNSKQVLIWMFVALITLPQILITNTQIKKMLTTYSPEQLSTYNSQKQKSDNFWLLFWYIVFAGTTCAIFAPLSHALYFASLYDYCGKIYLALVIILAAAFAIFMLGLIILQILRKLKSQPPVGTIKDHKPLTPQEAIFTTSLNTFIMMFSLAWLTTILLRHANYL